MMMSSWNQSFSHYDLAHAIQMPSKRGRKHDNEIQKPKRKKCAAKEKERNQRIGHGFVDLQRKIPFINTLQKVCKVKILNLASIYIAELTKALEDPNGVCTEESVKSAFSPQVILELQKRNSYSGRASEELNTSSSSAFSTTQSPTGDPGYASMSHGTPNSFQSVSPPIEYMDSCQSFPLQMPFSSQNFYYPSNAGTAMEPYQIPDLSYVQREYVADSSGYYVQQNGFGVTPEYANYPSNWS